jgi:hypothetical protein
MRNSLGLLCVVAAVWLREQDEGPRLMPACTRSSGAPAAPPCRMRIRHWMRLSTRTSQQNSPSVILEKLSHNTLPHGEAHDLDNLVWDLGQKGLKNLLSSAVFWGQGLRT